MEKKKLIALILSILLIVGTILNIVTDLAFIGWAIYWSWICSCLNIFISIVIIISVFKELSFKWYNIMKFILTFSNLSTLFILFIFVAYGYFNYAKVINIFILSPLLLVVHFIMKEMLPNSEIATPIANQPA